MSKTMSVGMAAKLAASGKRLAKMLRILRNDETVICMTDHDEELVYDLLGDGDETYLALGVEISDIGSTAGVEPDNVEVSGPISDDVTFADIVGARFQGARAWLFEVDWSDLTLGHIAHLGGQVAEPRLTGSSWTFDIRDWRELLTQAPGRALINTCDAEHTLPVDPRCGRTPETDTGTISAVVDAMQFTVTLATGGWAEGYFNKGDLLGLTGDNAGVKIKIESFTAAGVIKLRGFLPVTPQVGDTFTLIRGCGKTRPDCMERDNMEQFKGEPDAPGDDQLRKAPIPGQGNDD
jgi:uncharacterized phage protein (TIGR02218 family)